MDPISMNSYNMSNLLRISGLATGLDTDSIVQQLIRAASIPLDRLEQQKQWYQWQQEDLRDINSQLMSLRNDNVFKLKLQGTFMAKTVTSSNPSVATATAGANAVNGSYTISVSQLAQAATTASTDKIGAATKNSDGTYTYNALNNTGSDITLYLKGLDGNDKEIIIKNGATIKDVVAAINAKTNETGVSATYDPGLDRLFLVSNFTGTNSKIDFSGTTDPTAQNFLTTTLKLDSKVLDTGGITGQDALFTFNGVQMTSSTNNVTVAGINITLTGTSNSTTTLTVLTDVDKIYNTIKSFVDSYNDIITKINAKLTEKRYYDYPPLTSEQKQAMKDSDIKLWEEKARSGNLNNDETLMRVYYSMRNVVSSTVSGVGSLSSIGITTGQWYEGGKLYIDETKLKDAIANDLDKVMKIFAGVYETDSNGNTTLKTSGIAQNLYDTLKQGIDAITRKAGSTTQLYDTSFIGNRIREIDDRIAQMQRYLNDLEKRYYAQFTQLEMYVGQMNSQSAWLSQQIGVMMK
ncbi:flagellar filament capping protein FliD [Thermoanaerobacter sp. CM-CNRG TB177]|jgi:flagellar hook-associated protein 2|uniref:flagellar filament capping protein FliD n=1 Tax=Thermoanaerobacter sp. CM-CNRG TB177 TaxID=2800659 RepID=UPI000EE44E6A|nr:flagellar filament capping protein FliD [Thermoanaerobacter sp. CM-CNRG TB177]MBT1278252.1 flagellar filament capping protein FliD [Thermoanaerobacter sp. CM-CNRG TB177]HCD09840.1 flagellar hook protein FliD [Thermoanaerobacter sp.]